LKEHKIGLSLGWFLGGFLVGFTETEPGVFCVFVCVSQPWGQIFETFLRHFPKVFPMSDDLGIPKIF